MSGVPSADVHTRAQLLGMMASEIALWYGEPYVDEQDHHYSLALILLLQVTEVEAAQCRCQMPDATIRAQKACAVHGWE